MNKIPELLSIGELKLMISHYSDDLIIDFGTHYIASIVNDDSNILRVEWIEKSEQLAINAAKKKTEDEQYYISTSLPIEQSGLNKRLKTLLKTAGINSIYELAQNFPEDLISTINGLGWKSIDVVQAELNSHGWNWGGERINYR